MTQSPLETSVEALLILVPLQKRYRKKTFLTIQRPDFKTPLSSIFKYSNLNEDLMPTSTEGTLGTTAASVRFVSGQYLKEPNNCNVFC